MPKPAVATVDKDALTLARSIALTESGSGTGKPNYNAQGKSGERGAYQWIPGKYEAMAQSAGVDPKDFSPQSQDKVAYYQVKKWKDEGKQPWEIASMWNAGEGKPDAYQNHAGVNAQGVKYDTPAYVGNVKKNFLQLQPSFNPTPYSAPDKNSPAFAGEKPVTPQKQPGIIEKATDKVAGFVAPHAVDSLSTNLANLKESGKGLLSAPAALMGNKEAQEKVQQAVNVTNELPKGSLGQAAIAGGELALNVDSGPGAGALKGAIKYPGLLLEAVSPRLTPKVAAAAEKTAPSLVRGLIKTVPEKRTKEVAEAVRGIYNPAKTFSENALNVRNAIGTKAEALKQALTQRNVPYIFKELKSDFNNIEIPHFIKTSDKVVQKRAESIVNKFMEIARAKDGTLHSLLDARKEFDTWVKHEYPRVFDESGNAVNQLVSNVRRTANDFIEKRAADVGVKASLKEQNLLYDALDTFDEKAVLGELQHAGEIGSTYASRFAGRHPGLINAAKSIGGTAASIGLGVAGYNKLKEKVPILP